MAAISINMSNSKLSGGRFAKLVEIPRKRKQNLKELSLSCILSIVWGLISAYRQGFLTGILGHLRPILRKASKWPRTKVHNMPVERK